MYDDEEHARITLLDFVDGTDYVVASLTFDIFVEQMDSSNMDLESLKFEVLCGKLPLGINPANVFHFRPMIAAELDTLIQELG